MTQFYFNPARASDPAALPDAEVFYAQLGEMGVDADGEPSEAGWYYWSCFPGCMPDSDAAGPYATEAEAIADAQDQDDF